MPVWSPPYKIRRSTNILSFAVHQNFSALNLMGESCFLLKRFERANAQFQKDNRRISTMTTIASGYDTDPETGFLRYKLWGRNTHPNTEYPDIGVFTTTIQDIGPSGGTHVWEKAVDKYSFIANRMEYCFDIYQDEVDTNLVAIEDAMYIIFNTPPMDSDSITTMTYGTTNPLTKFESMQPLRDNEDNFWLSGFGFSQYMNAISRIRNRKKPNRFLVCFPDKLMNFTLTDPGFLRAMQDNYWTTPPPYSPEVNEFDVVVRENTGQRFQITNLTKVYVEDVFVGQAFELVELDPKSSLYMIPIITV
jgi:hypothetical protein